MAHQPKKFDADRFKRGLIRLMKANGINAITATSLGDGREHEARSVCEDAGGNPLASFSNARVAAGGLFSDWEEMKRLTCENGHDYSYTFNPAGTCRRCGAHG